MSTVKIGYAVVVLVTDGPFLTMLVTVSGLGRKMGQIGESGEGHEVSHTPN